MEMDKEKRVPTDWQKEAEQKIPPEVQAKMNELSPKAFAIDGRVDFRRDMCACT